ncbi:DEAD/DEAH box helicase family protein [bacterium]|nr:DEAD/DEAH box helicase family protein [bacterium]
MEIINLKKELEELKEDTDGKLLRLSEIEQQIKQEESGLKYIANKISQKVGNILEKEIFLDFFKKPYAVIPFGKNKILIAVPKFVKGFQIGWLWKETETFYIYQFDQYSAWLSDAPKELLEEINFKKGLELTVQGNTITFSPEWKEAIKKKLNWHLREVGENQAQIVRGHIFDVIAETIENGCLPFLPKPVSKEDLRESKSKIKLRPYQEEARKKFLETGAIGVFHPTGAGKSFIALKLLDEIKGKKIIIVPTRTLIEQWSYYIDTHIPHAKHEIKIVTYQGFRDNKEEYALTVYDECQRLPADTFSRLAVIPTKYRIGLSASPHREDGRESYIFALTGFPVGLNWQEYMATVGKSYHPIYVHLVRSSAGKLNKIAELLDRDKKTLIFCDTIEIGKHIAKKFDIPYIYGQTNNRLQEIQDNKVVAVSRVMDLGISIKDLQRIIEVDFLFGSRQQELQRTGRLMHSEKTNLKHDIIMTEAEFHQYGKRLWALQEKGFTIKVNH